MSWAEASGDPAAAYAGELLAGHRVDLDVAEPATARTTVADWAGSGAMALTGRVDGAPQLVPGAPATTVRGALLALAAVAEAAGLDASRLPDERLLGERAALMGLARRGAGSAGGAGRLIEAADGTVALTLSRPDDLAAVPALVQSDLLPDDPWQAVARWCREQSAADVVDRAALLGLAVGAVDHRLPQPASGRVEAPLALRRPSQAPLVVDLSSLWAGPLCAHLLGLAGSRVIDVESTRRPDPTRELAPAFHQLLRGGGEDMALDFSSDEGRAQLRELLLAADIVIESSRPRALAQLGIDASAIIHESGGVWISITAYGRDHNRIGYGDDVAAAAGLVGDGPVFAGDALADPMTGTHAATAALARWSTGQVGVVDLAMYDVARAARTEAPLADVVRRNGEWFVDDGRELVAVRAPAARQVSR